MLCQRWALNWGLRSCGVSCTFSSGNGKRSAPKSSACLRNTSAQLMEEHLWERKHSFKRKNLETWDLRVGMDDKGYAVTANRITLLDPLQWFFFSTYFLSETDRSCLFPTVFFLLIIRFLVQNFFSTSTQLLPIESIWAIASRQSSLPLSEMRLLFSSWAKADEVVH